MVALARVSGFVALVPIPGMSATPGAARIVFALLLTMGLLPVWPKVSGNAQFGDLAVWVVAEFALGMVMGVAISILLEAFQIGAQAIGLQAGFSYASTIDPSTQADTAVLQTVVQLLVGTLLFGIGLHLQLIRLLAAGLAVPPTAASVSRVFSVDAILHLGSLMFNTGLRLAMPVIGSLLLVDLAFALVAKMHAQLQLLSFSFAIKMLAGLVVCATTLSAYPRLLIAAASRTIEILSRLLN
jgi:flagellar biosynthetic protein FliR